MTKLDKRLKAVATFVARATESQKEANSDSKKWTHIDIGSDHGHLLKVLIDQGTITKAIAVEKNEAPLKRTQKALKGHNAECFLGDGFAPLKQDSANSASICGLGASTILQILQDDPSKIPQYMILQANKQSEKLRRWGYEHGYHLVDECMVDGFWNYAILLFEKKPSLDNQDGIDGAYLNDNLDFSLETLFRYGPHLLDRRDFLLLQTVKSEYEHFKGMDTANKAIKTQLSGVKLVLDYLS